MVFFCVVIYLPWNVMRTLSVNRFHSTSFYVLRDNHLSSNIFLIFSNLLFLMVYFPLSARFVNSICILTSTDSCWHDCSKGNNVLLTIYVGFHIFQEVWSAEFIFRELWLAKSIFPEPWWDPYFPLIFVCPLMFVNRPHWNTGSNLH